MPKVTQEYIDKKKLEIINGAMQVCKSKPAYEITLRDVVKACGISQGGMYHYFSNIDEVFAEILNHVHSELQIKDRIEEIFNSKSSPNNIVLNLLMLLGKTVDDTYSRFGKFIFELDAIFLNDPIRGRQIWEKVTAHDDSKAVIFRLNNFIETHIANGNFNSTTPRGHILFLMITAFDGIKKTALVPDSDKEALKILGMQENEYLTAENMMKVIAELIIKLLNT